MAPPIVKATLQACILSAISNTLAQVIRCSKQEIPISINYTEIFQFALYALLSCPPNFIWQTWLEAQFPGYTQDLRPSEKEKLVDELVTGQSTAIDDKTNDKTTTQRRDPHSTNDKIVSTKSSTPSSKLNLKNTAIKFTFDQTLGAANFLFLVGIGLLRQRSFSEIRTNVNEQFLPMIFAGQKLWPMVSILSFTVVPVEYRTIFGSIVGLFWGVYVSLLTG